MHLKLYMPAKFSWGWRGGPRFNTDIAEMVNGAEKRNGGWAQGRHAFKMQFQHLSPPAFQLLKGHHGIVRGMLNAFLFQDGMDPDAVDEAFAVGDATQTDFQLSKLASGDGHQYRRIVTALFRPGVDGAAIPVTPTITVDGDPAAGVTVDHDRGRVVFAAAPGEGAILRWSGPFSMWVRLDRDELDFGFDQPNGIYGQLGIIEVKPPKVPAS